MVGISFFFEIQLDPFGNVTTSATFMASSTNSWCNPHKLMGQDHKTQCLGKCSLILQPFLSLETESKEESMTLPTHTDFACTFGWLLRHLIKQKHQECRDISTMK